MSNTRYIPVFTANAFNNDQSVTSYLNALIRGGICCGYESIQNVDDTTIMTLTPPTGAVSAIISVEAGAGQVNSNVVVRFREDGGNPAWNPNAIGIALGNYASYEIKNEENLANFKAISTENRVQTLHVLYYK